MLEGCSYLRTARGPKQISSSLSVGCLEEEEEAGVYYYDDICFCPKALNPKVTGS